MPIIVLIRYCAVLEAATVLDVWLHHCAVGSISELKWLLTILFYTKYYILHVAVNTSMDWKIFVISNTRLCCQTEQQALITCHWKWFFHLIYVSLKATVKLVVCLVQQLTCHTLCIVHDEITLAWQYSVLNNPVSLQMCYNSALRNAI